MNPSDNPFFVPNNPSQGDKKLLGAMIPGDLADHFGLWAVCMSTTRSALLEEIIRDQLSSALPVKDIVITLAKRAFIFWEKLKNEKGMDIPLPEYKTHAADQLRKKKIPEKYIEQVLENFGKYR